MNKSLLALAVLGAFAGVASAQSSVTLYGTLDVSGKYVKNDGQARRFSEATDGINSSQLGFRGIEDLGGGVKAGFVLLSGINPDSGSTNFATAPNSTVANNQSKFFNRRSTVSLFSNAGEIRLGRDYTPTFWNMTLFDAFGFNGIGHSGNVRQLYNGTRQDNSIQYFLPSNLGGFYGQAMVSAAESGSTLDRPARYLGGRLGFAAGPFDVAAEVSSERFAVNGAVTGVTVGGPIFTALAGQKQTTYNVGGSWDFGVIKVLGYYDHEKVMNAKESMGSISAVVPLGQSEIHFGYDRSKRTIGSAASTTLDQFKATYQYNLSKRTAVYATASRLDNKDNTTFSLSGGTATTTPSGKSQGAEFGVRHFF